MLDMVEVSRQRRLSRESADSLSSFIRWSFAHLDPKRSPAAPDEALQRTFELVDGARRNQQEHQLSGKRRHQDELADTAADLSDNDDPEDEEAEDVERMEMLAESNAWDERRRARANTGSASLRQASVAKRPRYSPEASPAAAKFQPSSKRSSTTSLNNHLGNVVERLHREQQRQAPGAAPAPEQAGPFNQQQFLLHQNSFEDLCGSMGLDENNQLALAAVIQKALLGAQNSTAAAAANNNNNSEPKSTASSVGSSTGSSVSLQQQQQQHSQQLQHQQAASMLSQSQLIDSIVSQRQQRRAYNTRAGSLFNNSQQQANQLMSSLQAPGRLGAAGSNHLQAAAMFMTNNRLQQQHQRHAQAAAALSALANANSAAAAAAALHQQHQHPHQRHLQHPFLGSLQPTSNQLALQQHQSAGAALGQPIIDFKCDTCPSSFDDRHRLMQHQSIHLELKKDWFTETPVEEVMKIFNRRRGEFLCNICNLRFEATLDYDQHNNQVHGPRPYCCQFCGNGTRTFKCWRQYLNHLYDHRYVFSCNIDNCDFTVSRRDSLRFHIFRFHLNCQLPQGCSTSLQFSTTATSNNNNNNNNNFHSRAQNLILNSRTFNDSKWALDMADADSLRDLDERVDRDEEADDDEDTENEMNVAD